MVKFYVRRILVEKKMTIDEVPARWREAWFGRNLKQ